jgi:hypothetical protein
MKAIGFELKGLKASEYFDQGCVNELFNSTTTSLVSLINKRELTVPILLNSISEVLKGAVGSLNDCGDLFNSFPGSQKTNVDKYLKKLGKFLKVYEKVEASFVTGKLIGDMLVLQDIQLCRQVIQGKVYPCFTLVKPDDYPKKVTVGENIELTVGTKLDLEPEVKDVFANGAPVTWEIIEGPGTGSKSDNPLNSEGKSSITVTSGDKAAMIKLRAGIKDKNGLVKDQVVYEVEILEEVDSVALYSQAVVGIWDFAPRHWMEFSLLSDGRLTGRMGIQISDTKVSYYGANPFIYLKDGRYRLNIGVCSYCEYSDLTYPPTSFREYENGVFTGNIFKKR